MVYDSAFNGFNSLKGAIEIAKTAGMTDIQVIAVHNDALTAFGNTVKRGLDTGRFLSIQYFDKGAFRKNQDKIAKLRDSYPDVEIICYDNSQNKGSERPNGGQVSVDEATKWDYTIDKELYEELLDVLEDGIDKGRFTEDQAASLGKDLRGLARDISEPWGRAVRLRAERCLRRIRVYGDRLLQQEVRDGGSSSSDRQHQLGAASDGGVQGLSDNRISNGESLGTDRGVAQESPRQLDLFGNPIVSKQTKEKKGKYNGLLRDDEGVRPEGLPADRADGGGIVPGESETPGQERGGSDRSGETGSVGGSRQRLLDGLRPGDELNDDESAGTDVRKNLNNNRADRGRDYAPKGVDERIEANIAAIELMVVIS